MKSVVPECAVCTVPFDDRACRSAGGAGPSFCPTKNKQHVTACSLPQYDRPEIRKFAHAASIQEAECYKGNAEAGIRPRKTRMEEICDFAEKMGYTRLGLAFCEGLQAEASCYQEFLENRGFSVASVVCKAGCTPKEHIGITEPEKILPGSFEPMCSPITQAEMLNEAKTDFNIIMGLCVGHDSLFMKAAEAPVTVFAVKDRVLGHNPLAALYTFDSYYRHLKQ